MLLVLHIRDLVLVLVLCFHLHVAVYDVILGYGLFRTS